MRETHMLIHMMYTQRSSKGAMVSAGLGNIDKRHKSAYLESLTSKGPAKTAFWRKPRTISSKLLGTRALIDMRLRNA